MRTKRVFLAVSITALVVAILLISLRAYYVAVALIVGASLIGHREFWSLITRRKLPVIDERVRENIGKSVRNGFIFLVLALAFLMLPFSVRLSTTPETVHLLAALFLSAGVVYLFSYLFYDRVEPKLDGRWSKKLRVFLLVTGISLGAFIISVFLHNAISGLFHIEEPVFFVIALLSVVAFAVGLVGSLVIFIKVLFSRAS